MSSFTFNLSDNESASLPASQQASPRLINRTLNLRYMGFCGADDSVAPELLQVLSLHYPWVEWGFLLRPDMEGSPRYPTKNWIDKVTSFNKQTGEVMRFAGHLCGSRCQQVIDGDYSYVKELAKMGFGRIQVNATSANNVVLNSNQFEEYAENLLQGMSQVPELEWIIQANNESKGIWEILITKPASNMSILFDSSCGMGKLLSEFPAPFTNPDIKCGYAGGIGPSTIREVLFHVAKAAEGKAVWIDMESSLRVFVRDKDAPEKDSFSINKCFECIQVGVELGLSVGKFRLLSV